MNYPLISKILSILLATLALSFTASMFVGGVIAESNILDEWLACISIAVTLSILLYLGGRKANNKLFRQEALFVIGAGWILISFVGAIPYWMIVREMTMIDAFFEATSGFTTTGATVISNVESLPNGLKFWRCLSQWIGGLGVVVFFVAVLSFLGAGAKVLYSNEASAQSHELDASRVQQGVIRLIYLYLGLSALCTLAFWGLGMNLFDALCHMFTTISTGGFGNYSDSFGYFNSPTLEFVCIIFMFLGGTSFIFMLRIWDGRLDQIKINTEFRSYCIFTLIFSLLVAIGLCEQYADIPYLTAVRTATFQVLSIMTTTGFATVDFNLWIPPLQVIMIILMIIGGCSGSTAGGLKIVRVVVATKSIFLNIEKSFRPRVIRTVKMNRESLDVAAVDGIITYLVMAGWFFVLGLLTLAIVQHNVSFMGTITQLLACMFNIGPGFAEVGPTQTFAPLNDYAKIILSLAMIIGRLEFYAILALFAPSLWKGFN